MTVTLIWTGLVFVGVQVWGRHTGKVCVDFFYKFPNLMVVAFPPVSFGNFGQGAQKFRRQLGLDAIHRSLPSLLILIVALGLFFIFHDELSFLCRVLVVVGQWYFRAVVTIYPG